MSERERERESHTLLVSAIRKRKTVMPLRALRTFPHPLSFSDIAANNKQSRSRSSRTPICAVVVVVHMKKMRLYCIT